MKLVKVVKIADQTSCARRVTGHRLFEKHLIYCVIAGLPRNPLRIKAYIMGLRLGGRNDGIGILGSSNDGGGILGGRNDGIGILGGRNDRRGIDL